MVTTALIPYPFIIILHELDIAVELNFLLNCHSMVPESDWVTTPLSLCDLIVDSGRFPDN